jgi:hypothetical protein
MCDENIEVNNWISFVFSENLNSIAWIHDGNHKKSPGKGI